MAKAITHTINTSAADDYVEAVRKGLFDRDYVNQLAAHGDPLAQYVTARLDNTSVSRDWLQPAEAEAERMGDPADEAQQVKGASDGTDAEMSDAEIDALLMSILGGLEMEDEDESVFA